MKPAETDKKFESWKAIANYFGRSERTVRRWEAQEGLPVHRHKHLSGSRIFAYQGELETWFATRKQSSETSAPAQRTRLCIAVRPFEFLCEDINKAYLRDAICEDMVADMATLQSLTVISYSSMRLLPEDKQEQGRALVAMHLDLYVEGSILLEAGQLRLNIRLIDAATQAIKWTKRYSEPLANWHSLRQQVVAALVTSLPLSNAEPMFDTANSSTFDNQTAWEYLHQARCESLKWQPASIERAIQLLQAARQLVGNNGIILANLGRAYLQKREAAIDCSEQPMIEAESILAQLNQVQPDAYYTHSLMGWYQFKCGNMHQAIGSLRHALERQPNDPDTLGLLSNCYLITGQNDLARPLIKASLIVDPLTPLIRCLPGWYSLLNGDFSSAIGPYEDMLAMDPNNPVARLFMTWVYALNHDAENVVKTCDGFIPPLQQSLPACLAFAFRDGMLENDATFELNEHDATMASVNEMFARFVAFAYAATGQVEQATAWLERAFKLGFWAYPFLRDHDSYFRPYHQFPALVDLMGRMERKWSEQGNQGALP